eukprot:gene2879-4086_t
MGATGSTLSNLNPINFHPTEKRGITLAQLRIIYDEIIRRCVSENWKGFDNHPLVPEE